MSARRLQDLFLLLLAFLLVLPVLAILASWVQWDRVSSQILREMAATVLPAYAWTSLGLCVAVGVGVALVGGAAAAAVTLFDFRGRRTFEWALLLPLAMPAYVVAYAYTDYLQFSGPLQSWLRATFGLQGRVLPEVRSVGGAALVFIFSLYPYVYLLARTALAERAGHLMEAARLLGAPLRRRIRRVALPLARPAVTAGVALALMETLADFGRAAPGRVPPTRSRYRCGAAGWCWRGPSAACRCSWDSSCRCCSCCGRWPRTGRCCPGTASCSGRSTASGSAPSAPCWRSPWPC